VTTEAYERAIRALGLSPTEQWQAALHSSGAERQRILSHCCAVIRDCDIDELTTLIIDQARQLNPSLNGLWAVRSSATNEDGSHASFAGVYRTRLGVPLEKMGLAVKDLWL
jgi:pyruvate,water dikinase